MRTHNTSFLIVILIGVLITSWSLYSHLFQQDKSAESWIYTGLSIAEIGGLFMLFTNGTFILTKYYRFLKIIISLILVSIVFIIMYWPYVSILLMSCVVGIIFNYFFSFMAKPIHTRLDYLKLLWVIIYFSCVLLKYFHLVRAEYFVISSIVMGLAVVEYIRIEIKKGDLLT